MSTPTIEQLLEAVRNLGDEIAKMRNAPLEPSPLAALDEKGLLVHARHVGNMVIDPVVPAGSPTTVTMPVTGHVLSVPRPDLGESFIPYCQRVSEQAEGNVQTVGALFLSSSRLFAGIGGYRADGSNWPEAADKFFNLRSYMTQAERDADDAAKASWNVVYERMQGIEGATGGHHAKLNKPRHGRDGGKVPAVGEGQVSDVIVKPPVQPVPAQTTPGETPL